MGPSLSQTIVDLYLFPLAFVAIGFMLGWLVYCPKPTGFWWKIGDTGPSNVEEAAQTEYQASLTTVEPPLSKQLGEASRASLDRAVLAAFETNAAPAIGLPEDPSGGCCVDPYGPYHKVVELTETQIGVGEPCRVYLQENGSVVAVPLTHPAGGPYGD